MIKNQSTDRSIKDDHRVKWGRSMTSEVIKWWKGLGTELEDDIESFDD